MIVYSVYTVKKEVSDFPVPSRDLITKLSLAGKIYAGMSLSKLSLAENNLIIPGQGKFG